VIQKLAEFIKTSYIGWYTLFTCLSLLNILNSQLKLFEKMYQIKLFSNVIFVQAYQTLIILQPKI
jgi:hypothetical protein